MTGEQLAAGNPLEREAGVIRLENVTVRRGASDVLRNVSLQIPAGRLTAIVGPSGAGKTTLVNVLNGLILPNKGAVTVSDLGRLDAPAALKRHRGRTSTIFQDHALIERLSAFDNVLLGFADIRHPLSILPWPSEIRRRAAEALEQVDLLHHAHTRVERMSGGERQRVGIARAFARRPRLLLGDEPFSSVDPTLVEQMGAALRRAVSQSETTVVVVLHHLEVAQTLADWVIGLNDGAPLFVGPPEAFDAAAQRRVFQRQEREAPVIASNQEFTPCLASPAL